VAGSEPVAVVSAAFAHAYFDGEALGKTIRMAMGPDAPAMRIVGVVGDSRQHGPAQAAPAILYTPLAQLPDELFAMLRQFVPLSYLVRLHPGAPLHEHEVRDVVASASP